MKTLDANAGRRVRRWGTEAALVAVAALSAVAVAQASRIAPSPRKPPEPAIRTLIPSDAGVIAARDDEAFIVFEEPVPGHAVVSPFGLRQLPWEGAGRLHEGVDISADAGVPVRVSAEGVVVAAGEKGGYGRYVAVRHAEGLTSFYAHLGRIAPEVKPGLAVAAGAEVGKVGSTGSSTGPHLHFEIRDAKGRPLNPAMFLGRAFAEAGDLPLDKAKRYSGRVRIAQVSFIPESKRALMAQRQSDVVLIKRDLTKDLAAAERNLSGLESGVKETMPAMGSLAIGPDGRPRAQLNF